MDPSFGKLLIRLVVDLPLLLFAVSFHESAHGLAAAWLGDNTARKLGRVTLDPFKHLDLWGSLILPVTLSLVPGLPILAYAKPTPVDVGSLRFPKRDFSLVALAGPVSNLVLALFFCGLGWLLVGVSELPWPALGVVCRRAIELNLFLAFFNLIPLPTLDGLKACYAVLPDSWCWALNRLEAFGMVVIMLALYLGILSWILGPTLYCRDLLYAAAHLSV